jgi:hypothetical protein
LHHQPLTDEPPRIRKFRRELVKVIPRIPNNKESLLHMQQKPFGDLMIDYVNWRSRHIGVRSRTVGVEPAAKFDPRWTANSAAISLFLDKVRHGDNLTPHLSIEPHTRGYTVAARAPNAPPADKWSDKDFILNINGYHHFHLGTKIEAKGHAARTDDVIFAEVTRDHLTVIAVFDHSVFEFGSPERMRLAALHETIVTRGIQPGTICIGAAIATSGHTLQVVRYAQHCLRLMAELEPKLAGCGNSLYGGFLI